MISVLLAGFSIFAQVDDQEVLELFDVSQSASFKGGEHALMMYLAKNTRYPEIAIAEGIEGIVMLEFVVRVDGSVADLKVISKLLGYGLEEEAIRVIKSTKGKWTPATQKGEAVNVRLRQPLSFKLT